MWNAMTNCGLAMLVAAMRHDPASGAIVIMLRSLKMHGMAQAVTDLIEQGAPAFEAAVPILTIIGTGFALLISGVVVTESVFNIPGIGRLTVDAILARDYPVIQAMILLTAGIYVLVNLIVDVSYSFFDPRIRY